MRENKAVVSKRSKRKFKQINERGEEKVWNVMK